MNRFIPACLLAFSISTQALTIDQARQALSLQTAASDSMDIAMSTQVSFMGKTISSQIRTVSKGKDKVWTTMTMPMGTQTIIKNGLKYQITDFTGKKTVTNLPQALPFSQSVTALDSGMFSAPQKNSAGYFVFSSIGNIGQVSQRVVVYDSVASHILSINDIFIDGKTSSTSITYDKNLSNLIPSLVNITVTVGSNITSVTLQTTAVRSSSPFPDAYFNF